ncbi:MAG: thiamine phosphate synthase, partial [Gemmatimonadales bacterium]
HPGAAGRGLDWLAEVVAVGVPVFAIGGVTKDRLPALRLTGVWGVAAISAVWSAPDAAKAADQLVRIWSEEL